MKGGKEMKISESITISLPCRSESQVYDCRVQRMNT